MQLIGLVLLLGCAEWVLIFRTWVSFRYLLLYAGAASLRQLMRDFPFDPMTIVSLGPR